VSSPFEAARWSLELPKRWLGEWENDIAVIYAPGGMGALQISEYQKLETEITDEDLLESIEEVPQDQATPFSAKGFVGFHYCYSDDATHWKIWLLRDADIMLFVTYNCNVADAKVEEQEVIRAVRSITPRKTCPSRG